jgi:hypothetical protein
MKALTVHQPHAALFIATPSDGSSDPEFSGLGAVLNGIKQWETARRFPTGAVHQSLLSSR